MGKLLSHLCPDMEIECPTMEAFSLEIAKIASRVLLGLIYVHASALVTSVHDSFAVKLIGKGKKAQGENVDDGKIDDDSGQIQHYGGENGDILGRESHNSDDNGDDYESDEQHDASDQEGNGDHGREEDDDDDYDENGDEEDVDEEFTEEDEDDATSGSDTDEDPLLSHAMEVYTPDSFSLFKHEYEKSRVLSLDVTAESGLDFKYKVKKMESHGHSCKVTASFLDGIVECCCNHFAVTGMLCSHALAVLNCLRIEKIPDQYLLKWRMKSPNPSLMEVTSFRGRRQIHPSLDDCLSGDLGRGSSIKTNASEEDSPRLIWPGSEDDKCRNFDHFGSPILRHAKQIYAPDTYDLFREEYRKSGYLFVQILHNVADWRGLVYDFEVFGRGHTDVKKVHAEAKDGTVKCICRKFEMCGILCSHALAAYSSISVVRIPQQYIVPKLLKDPNLMYVQQQQIHGAEYQKMLRFACYMFQASGSTTLRSSFRFGGEEEDRIKECLAEIKDELRELSQDHSDKERREMVFMGKKGKFYDDQLIKDFTYKKSETRKRKLMDYLSSSPLKIF